jgi:uncharacterized protein
LAIVIVLVGAEHFAKAGRMPHGFDVLPDITVAPRVWVLAGDKAGNSNQVLALTEALGWPFEIKKFVYRAKVSNLPLRATLAGIDNQQSSPVEPPWPDLVIAAGRLNESIARWIKQQSPDTVRLVHVGRPWSSLDYFDLIVTTPQHCSPIRPNVLNKKTHPRPVTKVGSAGEAARWRDRFAHLPPPFTAVIIGASSTLYRSDRRVAERVSAPKPRPP